MRIWSIHPKYLDRKRLVALWRETLLAKKVLSGKTKGYKNHPQLNRFKKHRDPILVINTYLESIYNEAKKRGYKFKKTKIGRTINTKIKVTAGQLNYEFSHLMKKVNGSGVLQELNKTKKIQANPIFRIIEGGVEDWERVK